MPARLHHGADKPKPAGAFLLEGRGLRAMKILVAAMGAAIVAGVAIVVVTIYNRAVEKARAVEAAAAPMGEVSVPVPAGHRAVSVSADGGRLYVHLAPETGGAPASILVLDAASGAEIGRILLQNAR